MQRPPSLGSDSPVFAPPSRPERSKRSTAQRSQCTTASCSYNTPRGRKDCGVTLVVEVCLLTFYDSPILRPPHFPAHGGKRPSSGGLESSGATWPNEAQLRNFALRDAELW